MSQKQPKPTLSGQRIRTRKRGACIVWSLVKKFTFFRKLQPFMSNGGCDLLYIAALEQDVIILQNIRQCMYVT